MPYTGDSPEAHLQLLLSVPWTFGLHPYHTPTGQRCLAAVHPALPTFSYGAPAHLTPEGRPAFDDPQAFMAAVGTFLVQRLQQGQPLPTVEEVQANGEVVCHALSQSAGLMPGVLVGHIVNGDGSESSFTSTAL